MKHTHDASNSDAMTLEPSTQAEHNGAPQLAQEDITLPDAQSEVVPDPEPPSPAKNAGLKFLDFLASPIVEIIVAQGADETILTAHQSLLLESPFLTELVNKFELSGPRRISLPEEDVDTFGCFLQFQYTRDYTIAQPETPEASPEDRADRSGGQLLRHARIYTLAEKLGLPALKSLAHSKIHRVNGTSSGELAYARYVYTHISPTDMTIRKPIASYWPSRGHLLRHDVAEEWRKLCLEVPQFAFDVLTLVLDRREKQSQSEADSSVRGSARKRLRSGA